MTKGKAEKANGFAALAGGGGRVMGEAMSADADVIGIDPGTTQSLVGWWTRGFPILLVDGPGSRMTRSAVYDAEDGTVMVDGVWISV